jgi:hypothetical protein
MAKTQETRADQKRKKVNLADKYRKIGITAVAAALQCKTKNSDAPPRRKKGIPIKGANIV